MRLIATFVDLLALLPRNRLFVLNCPFAVGANREIIVFFDEEMPSAKNETKNWLKIVLVFSNFFFQNLTP